MTVGTAIRGRTAQRFQVQLAAVTLLPWLLVPVLHFTGLQIGRTALIVWLGGPHVAGTAAFYFDAEFRPMLAANRVRLVVAPLALIAGCLVWFTVSPSGNVLLLEAAGMWGMYHFNRQNFGCFAFLARSRRQPLIEADRRLFQITGVLAVVSVEGHLWDHHAAVWLAGWVIAGYALWHVLTVCDNTDPALFAGRLVGVVFFVPALMSHDRFLALVGYGAAHGAQYILMVAHLPNGRERAHRALMWGVVIGVFVLLAPMLRFFEVAATGWLFGLSLGTTTAHYAIDSGVWKMRDPEQRAYMGRRFEFL